MSTVHFAEKCTLPHWHIVIPGSPMRVNACWEPHRRGSRATIGKTKEYRAYQNEVKRSGICLGLSQIDVPVVAQIDAYFARQSRKFSTAEIVVPDADVDACVKPLLDTLEHVGVLMDDKLVMRCELNKHLDRDDPRVEVRIWKL